MVAAAIASFRVLWAPFLNGGAGRTTAKSMQMVRIVLSGGGACPLAATHQLAVASMCLCVRLCVRKVCGEVCREVCREVRKPVGVIVCECMCMLVCVWCLLLGLVGPYFLLRSRFWF